MPARRPKDPIKAAARRARAQRRVGETAVCACGEKRPEALIAGRKQTICHECDARRCSKASFEAHHVAGRANSPVTLSVPINDHRAELSVDQYEWPSRTLQNPDASPHLANAARVRGFMDMVGYLMRELLGPIPGDLEAYDAELRGDRSADDG